MKTDEQILNNLYTMGKMKQNGCVFIKKNINKFPLVVGSIFLGIALIPNGLGFVFYPLGLMTLGIPYIDLKQYNRKMIRKVKSKSKCLVWSIKNE